MNKFIYLAANRVNVTRNAHPMTFSQISNIYLMSRTANGVDKRFYKTRAGIYGTPRQEQSIDFKIAESALHNQAANSQLYRWVSAYREHGHKKAMLDPLGLAQKRDPPELTPELYGIDIGKNDKYNLQGIFNSGPGAASPSDLKQLLETTYCGPFAAEFMHLTTMEERQWFAEEFEKISSSCLTKDEKINLGKILLKTQAFDNLLASKFATVKRYGGEGSDPTLGFCDELLKIAADQDIKEVILCNAHRGRLNILACLLKYPVAIMCRKMKGLSEFPDGVQAVGDVLSHLSASVDLEYGDKTVHVTMLPNPSHLEAVNGVALGKTRARLQTLGAGDYAPDNAPKESLDKVLCFQLHGDGAFTGQGCVAECFTFAEVPHYQVWGSIHLILNNQLAYTTQADNGRSSLHVSDLAKMNGYPVLHVNADHPEELVKACRLAMAYRAMFHKDVIVDLVCFRKFGHNEMDEPSFTQPVMYNAIRGRQSIPDHYADLLVEEGVCSRDTLQQYVVQATADIAAQASQADSFTPKAYHLEGPWSGLVQAPPHITRWDTGLPPVLLKYIGAKSVELPPNFRVHSTLKKTHIDRRLQKLTEGRDIDWATAEALAIGGLLYRGFHVRISGQDVGRGTFSQRHAMLVDQETEDVTVPLNSLIPDQKGFLEIGNSVLSEEAVLAFEYGASIEHPNRLVIWEAQFGDFFNGAQIIIDTFITCGETKWLLHSGLVMLLPHGIDGMGPEHSSCRIERFLQMTDSLEDGVDGDNVNFQFVNPSTPAQYYHVLSRQMVRNFRKPLVLASPKLLLRHPSCVSELGDFAEGRGFEPVLGDTHATPDRVKRVVCCSGKHYYTLHKHRQDHGLDDVALIRVESLCPFPANELRDELKKYTNATKFIWSQEEHRNHGAWSFVAPRFSNVVGYNLSYAGRGINPTPATGIGHIYQKQKQQDSFENGSRVDYSNAEVLDTKQDIVRPVKMRIPMIARNKVFAQFVELPQLLSVYERFEEQIRYKFNDRSYLVEAFTAPSSAGDANNYQRLEFLGDAILDCLITRCLYLDPRDHSPGILNDLRAALVNNSLFATLAVGWGFHSLFHAVSTAQELNIEPSLRVVIDTFIKRQQETDAVDLLGKILSNNLEEEFEESEETVIPKVFADLYESVAGAIYLDSEYSLEVVWDVYYPMLKSHIDILTGNTERLLYLNPIRKLLEMEPTTAKFEKLEQTSDGKFHVAVAVEGKGYFVGAGRNYRTARINAARRALKEITEISQQN